MTENEQILKEEMNNRGWLDNDWRAGLAAIIGGESRFIPKFETGYSHTSNDRIRSIFRSRTVNLTDVQLNEIKSSDRTWFNFVYGGRFGNQPDTDDGFNYRGGGFIQLTFRDNYEKYGGKVGVDLVNHPELINTPRVAAAVAVEYMKDRFHGGDFDAMKRAVGVSIGNPDEEKNRLYEEYTQSGEWDYEEGAKAIDTTTTVIDDNQVEKSPVVLDPVVTKFLDSLHELETFLKNQNLYFGGIDNDPGPGVRMGLKVYLKKMKGEN